MKIENQHIKPDSPFSDNFLLLSAYPSLYLLLIHAVIRFPHILLKGFITIRVCYNITYIKLQGKWKFLLRRYLPGFLKDCRLSFLGGSASSYIDMDTNSSPPYLTGILLIPPPPATALAALLMALSPYS